MSKSLNGCVRSHASTPAYPFNSIRALADNDSGDCLTSVARALASNDPVRVARSGAELDALLRDVESLIRVSVRCIARFEEEDANAEEKRDVRAILETSAAMLSLCNAAAPVIDDASLYLKEGRHE